MQAVGGVAGPVVQAVGGVAGPVVQAVGGVAGPVVQAVGGVAGPVVQAVGGVAGPVVQAVGGVAGPVVQAVGGAAGPVVQAVGGVAGAVVQAVGGVAGPVVQAVGGVAGPVVQAVGGVAGAVVQAVGGVAGPVVQAVGGVAGPVVQAVGGVAGLTAVQPASAVTSPVTQLTKPADLGDVNRSLPPGNATPRRMPAASVADALRLPLEAQRARQCQRSPARRCPGFRPVQEQVQPAQPAPAVSAGLQAPACSAARCCPDRPHDASTARLARRATLRPIWRCYLPEVPPA